MKIFHCLMSREFAGTEQHLAQLAKYQAEQGHEVHILLKDQSLEIKARWRQETTPELTTYNLQLPTFHYLPRRWPKRLAGFWSRHLAKKWKPDVAHAHLGRAARYLGRGCQWAKVPLVCTLHLRFREKDAAHANALIAIASWQLAEIPESLRAKTSVIWNWANPSQAASKGRAFTKPGKTCNFLSVGRLVPQKGMDVLLEAFLAAFPPEQNDVHLTLVGEGAERGKLQDLAEGDPRITFAGYQASVAPFYGKANAFVSAARYEPFGLVILEAMQHGLPLICTKTEGPSEFLAAYPITWADKNSPTSLAYALEHTHKLWQINQLPRQTYDMSPFSLPAAAARIQAVYASLAKPQKSS